MKDLLKELKESRAELNNLKQDLVDLEKNYESRANDEMHKEMEKDDKMSRMMEEMGYLYKMVSSLGSYIYKVEDALYNYAYKHGIGHPPSFTASQMEKLLKNCGADGDYEISRPVISVSSIKGSKGLEITASLKK